MKTVSNDENSGKEPDIAHTTRMKIRPVLSQVLACCAKYLIMLDIGMGISYSAVAIQPLISGDESVTMTEDEASWFASLVYIWQPVGSMITVYLSRMGRKKSMMYLQTPILIGWIIPYFANTVWELYLASSIMGLGIGFMQAPIATYIGEICEPKYRGLLAAVAYCFLTLGTVVIYAIDVLTGYWRTTAIISAVVPVFSVLFFIMLPESPVWLVSQGRFIEAKKALQWLRGWTTEAEIEAEFRTMLSQNPRIEALYLDQTVEPVSSISKTYTVTESEESRKIRYDAEYKKNEKEGKIEKEESFFRYCCRPEMYKPIILSIVYMYVSNGSGPGALRSYLVVVFSDLHVEVNEYVATLVVCGIGLIGNIVNVALMPILGKRKLTFISVILCIIGMVAIGVYIELQEYYNATWIPVVLFIELLFSYNLGTGHIAWVLLSEIFPLRGRSFAAGLTAGLGNLLQFVGIKLFYTYCNALTLPGVFFMYSIVYLLGLIYLYFFQIETENKTIEQINEEFRTGRKTARANNSSI